MSFPYLDETKTLNDETRRDLPGEFVKLSEGVTHYELGGPEDGQPVVLVHGFSVPNFIWDPTFDALTAAGLRVLRYDLFGRGFSDRPRKRYDFTLFDRQLFELVEALEIERPFSLMGLSMGGPISANFTDRHPELVAKLVLIDPAGVPIDAPFILKLMLIPGMGELFLGLFGSKALLESMTEDLYDPKDIKLLQDGYRPQMEYKGFKRALLSTMREDVLGDALPIYKRIGDSDLPVLLIWGREDRTVPFAHSQFVLDALPQAQFHPIDDTGHIPHFERPEIVNPLLIEFLGKS
ncbi:MAG: alpha/beta fold hydrolase [Chloroflexi bacterium]|nr:alpha/beta fold hydrolase [Chloroflexota bacterium]